MRISAAVVLIHLVVFTAHAQSLVPLSDLGEATYRGFQGGLYPKGSNEPPPEHRSAGLAFAREVQPLDAVGNPSRSGRIVLLSIGMSNTTQEYCSQNAAPPCSSWSFTGQALASPKLNRTTLVIANGAMAGQVADTWDSPTEPNYSRIRDNVLRPQNVTEAQVQVAWVKVANRTPQRSLPAADADAYRLVEQMGEIARSLRSHYPNLKLIFFSSRIYAGYATTNLNPEPYAYESAFAVKWLVEAQIEQMRNGGRIVNARAGNLDYNATVPWIGWGPYLWANGATPRSDGLVWERRDLQSDGTHPSPSGQQKVGAMLLEFFVTNEVTRDWFTAAEAPRRRPVRR